MIPTLLLVVPLVLQDTSRLTLVGAVERALATHPTVAAAQARRDRASADVGDARSGRLPKLTLDGSVTRFQEPMVVQPLHGFDPRNPPLFDQTLVQGGLSLTWTLFDFGGRAAKVRVYRALQDAADAALTTAQQDLVARVVNSYLQVLSDRDVLEAQDQRLAALAAESARVAQLLAQGKAARLDQLRVDAEFRRANADRIAGAGELDVAEHELAQLTQVSYERVHAASLPSLRLADSLFAIDTSLTIRTATMSRAHGSSSDLQELEQRVKAANAGLAVARATRFPELRLSGAYADRGRWWNDFSAEWQVGVGVSYPIDVGGGRRSAIHRAQADGRIASEQLRGAHLDIDQAVDRALAALREAHARAEALGAAVEQSAEVARIEQLSLGVGSGIQSDFLEAEANLLAARASLISAHHQEISARVALARLLGELSPGWLARTVESSS